MTTVQPPGMYPDPADPSRLRRWDGAAWTNEYRDRPPENPPSGSNPIVPIGYVTALLIPIIGLVLGIVALCNTNPKVRSHGGAILMLSIVVAVVVTVVIINAMPEATTTTVTCEPWEYC